MLKGHLFVNLNLFELKRRRASRADSLKIRFCLVANRTVGAQPDPWPPYLILSPALSLFHVARFGLLCPSPIVMLLPPWRLCFALCGHFMPPIANDTGTLSTQYRSPESFFSDRKKQPAKKRLI